MAQWSQWCIPSPQISIIHLTWAQHVPNIWYHPLVDHDWTGYIPNSVTPEFCPRTELFGRTAKKLVGVTWSPSGTLQCHGWEMPETTLPLKRDIGNSPKLWTLIPQIFMAIGFDPSHSWKGDFSTAQDPRARLGDKVSQVQLGGSPHLENPPWWILTWPKMGFKQKLMRLSRIQMGFYMGFYMMFMEFQCDFVWFHGR